MATRKHSKRYAAVSSDKATGSTYTPPDLADFVAREMLRVAHLRPKGTPLRILDPAAGEGELLASLLNHLPDNLAIEVHGFDSNERALQVVRARLKAMKPRAPLHLSHADFLDNAIDIAGERDSHGFDLVIANPPYVRTQIMGAKQARMLANQFGLTGRVDLYYAFLLAIAAVLRPDGVAGIIVSNRFMTTRAGLGVRRAIRERFDLKHVWDLGDTKLFGAAVLPAVLIANGKRSDESSMPKCSTIYETSEEANQNAPSVIAALGKSGVLALPDGRRFRVQHGALDKAFLHDDTWRIATGEGDAWLARVAAHTWGVFGDIGRVRVGVKTCADAVFIRTDWHELPKIERPELLRTLTTHHIGRRFRAESSSNRRQILYPYECVAGKRRVVALADYPRARAYLERHRAALEARSYVIAAGRKWYEIWVPHDPDAWERPKLVFRDIAEEPCFWISRDRSIVNGDCYWLICEAEAAEDLLWLAASVGNSKFIETFYDRRFNNKLYAGRRRFITQYVEQFPLPDPNTPTSQEILRLAKKLYANSDEPEAVDLAARIDWLVSRAFGCCAVKKPNRDR